MADEPERPEESDGDAQPDAAAVPDDADIPDRPEDEAAPDEPPPTLAAELVAVVGASRLPADDRDDEDEEPPPTPHPDLPRGSVVGRYTILGRLATSRADVVFGAYDPTHERKVAIKLVRITQTASDADEDAARQRMLEEAEGLAKLSHPCIATVYEVGVLEGHIFLAMEFLDGIDLRSWMEARDEPFPWAEVLGVFREAGRGLAAAHRGGLVHRDFSPTSVLLCKGGRICVLDFGLGREETPADEFDVDISELKHSFPGDAGPTDHRPASITRRGLTLGSPHYMAPEVHISHRSDAKADQFSFCVALYEALYGERPFSGNRPIAIAMEAVKHNVRPAPEGTDVPAWLRAVVVRGLHPRPDDRWPSMEALLRELARDPAARRRRWAAAAGVAAVLAGGAWVLARQVRAEAATCAPDEAALAGIWDAGRRAELHGVLAGSGRPWADEVWTTSADAIDHWTAEWTMLSEAACVATRIRGEASEDLYSLRRACLDEYLGQIAAFGRAVDSGTPEVLDGAYRIAATLVSARVCTFSEDLERRPHIPSASREHEGSVRDDVRSAEGLWRTGDTHRALQRADAVVVAAEPLGYAPLTVDAQLTLGGIQGDDGRWPAATRTLHAAAVAAARAKLDRPLARSWLELTRVTAAQGDATAAQRWADYAEAVIDRNQYEALRPRLAEVRGDAAAAGRQSADAIAYYYRAAALEEQRQDTHPLRVEPLWRKLGALLLGRGDYAAAVGHFQDALDTLERYVGPKHPDLGPVLEQLAEAQLGAGEVDTALASLGRALEVTGDSADERHRAAVLIRMGEIEATAGRASDAAEHFTRAETALREVREGASALLGRALLGHGRALLDSGDPAAAVEQLRRAIAIYEVERKASASLARARFALARALWSSVDDREAAIELAQRAQRDFAAIDDPSASELAATQRWLDEHTGEPGETAATGDDVPVPQPEPAPTPEEPSP